MKERLFYSEFHPRDFVNFQYLLNRMILSAKWQFRGKCFDLWEFEVGRVPNNAELYYFKASVWSDTDKINQDL